MRLFARRPPARRVHLDAEARRGPVLPRPEFTPREVEALTIDEWNVAVARYVYELDGDLDALDRRLGAALAGRQVIDGGPNGRELFPMRPSYEWR